MGGPPEFIYKLFNMKSLLFIALYCGVAFVSCQNHPLCMTVEPNVGIDIYGGKPGETVSIAYIENGIPHLADLLYCHHHATSLSLTSGTFITSTELLDLSTAGHPGTIFHSKLNIYLNGTLEKSHNLNLKFNGQQQAGQMITLVDSAFIDGTSLPIDTAEIYTEYPDANGNSTIVLVAIGEGFASFKYQIQR